MILFSEAQARQTVREYVAHYHLERNHQGVGNRRLKAKPAADSDGEIVYLQHLGGMLKYDAHQAV